MDDQQERILYLLNRYAGDQISRSERDELLAYIEQTGDNPLLHDYLFGAWNAIDTEKELPEPDWDAMLESIVGQKKVVPLYRRLLPYVAAACILLFISIGFYLLKNRNTTSGNQQQAGNLMPGTRKSTLKIGGRTIVLDEQGNGALAQNKAQVQKTGGDQLVYTSNTNNETMVYDTIQVPRGGRPYHLRLADGSAVWLNAATTLRFPETAKANDRGELQVITGEAYFDIVHNPAAPVVVKTPRENITDIGTQFDVNAYMDEPDSRITLVEGKIDVGGIRLKPAQQLIHNGVKYEIADADIDQVLAWKNNKFVFNNESIASIMRKISRWYDVDVVYQSLPEYDGFSGSMTRFDQLSHVLHKIELTNKVHFKIEGRRLTVMK